MEGNFDNDEDFPLEYDDEAEAYLSSAKIKLLFIFLLFVACVLVIPYSMTVYGEGMSVSRMFELLINHLKGATYPAYSKDWFDDIAVWDQATPRVIFTIFAGVGLAVAGAAMQSCMNNPLADPYTVGVSSGACLGLAVAMVMGLSLNGGDIFGIVSISFVFSLIPLLVIISLAPRTRSSPSTLILAGVALSYIFNAANTILMITTSTETMEMIYKWQTGTLSDLRWYNLPLVISMVTVGSIAVTYLSRRLNLLSLGDASASSLGVDPDNLRIICLFAIAFIVGAVVGNAGVIGFVGLVTPHIARMVMGSDNRYVIPASALLSVLMMVVSDIICRTISSYDDIPVGAVLALIGAPIFLYLIVRRKSRVW